MPALCCVRMETTAPRRGSPHVPIRYAARLTHELTRSANEPRVDLQILAGAFPLEKRFRFSSLAFVYFFPIEWDTVRVFQLS